MAERRIHPFLRQALELGPTIVFFAIYMWIKDRTFAFHGTEYSGFIVAALVFVPILLAAMAVLWALSGALSRIQVFTGVVVVFFGVLTVWFNDKRFFMMKTTLVYGSFTVVLGLGLLRGRSWLQWIMGSALPMRDEGWMILTRRLALVFAALATLNEVIWRTQSEETWVWIETFVFPVLLFVFLMAQMMALGRYVIEDDDKGKGPPGDDARPDGQEGE